MLLRAALCPRQVVLRSYKQTEASDKRLVEHAHSVNDVAVADGSSSKHFTAAAVQMAQLVRKSVQSGSWEPPTNVGAVEPG